MLVSSTAAAAVGGGADVEQVQRVGHDGRGQHVVLGDRLAVAGVGVGQPGGGVLHLDLGEVRGGGAVEVHATAGVEREVGRVGHPQQPEAQPVRVVPPLAGVGRQEPLRRGVGTDDEGHLGQPGQDARAGGVDGLGAGGAGGVRRRDAGAVPAEGLGEGRPGDVAGVAVADGLATDDEVDLGPGTSASASAARAAWTPYSTKGRPHLPHGCMPTPRTATSWLIGRPSWARTPHRPGASARCVRSPLGVGVQGLDDQLDLRADDARRRRRSPRRAGRAPPAPRAARRRRARRAGRARWPGRTAAAAGTARRCRTRRGPAATARPPRTRRRRSRAAGRTRSTEGSRGKKTVPHVVQRGPEEGRAPVRW